MGLAPTWQSAAGRTQERGKKKSIRRGEKHRRDRFSTSAAFTFLLPHAKEEDKRAEDIDAADDARSDHVSFSLEEKHKNGKHAR